MATLSVADLKDLEVYQWPDLADKYKGADVLLGNGFSMNITPAFGYNSLFASFINQVGAADRVILAGFGTTNFEFILEDLGTAERVNGLMGLSTATVATLSRTVREGLIRAIEENHPRKHRVDWKRLESLATQLGQFGDIFTLNYDALLYHIIMICKDRWDAGDRAGRYNDYFWNRITDDHLQFMDVQNIKPYKHVYYPHGALFLFKFLSDETKAQYDVKLRTNAAGELLDAIAGEIRAGTLPLFVSEGRSEEKKRAISRSDYLRFANDALEAPRNELVVYGTSLGEQDAHIAVSVRRGTKRAAVSIFTKDRPAVDLEQEINLLRGRLAGVKLTFFDSASLFA